MVNKELPDILERLSEIFSEELFNVKMHKKVYFQVLQNKQAKFEELLDLIRTKWVEFKDINQKRVINKTYTNFLYDHFHEFFIFYLKTFFGFDENSLEMVLKENISDDNLLIEYNYNLEPREIKLYEQFSERIQTNLDGLIFFTLYLYMLIAVIGILIRRTIGEKILITLDCGTIKNQ